MDSILNTKKIGDRIQIDVMRGRNKLTLGVTLAELPGAARQRI